MCGARGHRNGETRTSLSTTTMPRLTGPLKSFSVFGQEQHDSDPPSPILTRSVPLWLFPLPQTEASDEGSNIRNYWRDSRGIAAGTWHNSKKGLPGMLPSMAETLGTAVFVQKGSTLKVMEEFNIQGKQTSFYKYCPGTFRYTLVYIYIKRIRSLKGERT